MAKSDCNYGCAEMVETIDQLDQTVVKLKAALRALQRYIADLDARLCTVAGPNKCRVHSMAGFTFGMQHKLVEVGDVPGAGEAPISQVEWDYHACGHRNIGSDPSVQRMMLGLDR